MPAEITTREDGTVEMAYTGKTPWHGLGVHVDNPMTAAEAIELAGLDWTVESRPVYTRIGKNYTRIPNKQALVRSDNDDIFQVFSNAYKPVQNKEAFQFFDGVVGAGEAIYETAGSLRGGRRVWILAKLPGDLDIGDGDLVNKYILLANGHDGSMQVTFKLTPIRVVCNNTLEAGLSLQSNRQVKYRHTINVLSRINNTREMMGMAEAHFELFMRQATQLAEKAISAGELRDMARQVFKVDALMLDDQIPSQKREVIDRVEELFYDGTGAQMNTANGTAWGAFNAVTEYIDHEMKVSVGRIRNSLPVAENDQRLALSWFGRGQDMRQRAWDVALAIAS